MQLDTIAIKNFHCFGPDGVSIELADPVTALIGANGSGKAVQVHPELYFAKLVALGWTLQSLDARGLHLLQIFEQPCGPYPTGLCLRCDAFASILIAPPSGLKTD